ncbi:MULTISPECIES: hypothetical protein [unclassified Moorena]|uniref:hypothetical protein n=1 Tax=unclassified Moorena TaxID=2683338 RepID=UPI00257A5C4C|nr:MULTISPECIES: hypothetical protein [unclassified Moorena]
MRSHPDSRLPSRCDRIHNLCPDFPIPDSRLPIPDSRLPSRCDRIHNLCPDFPIPDSRLPIPESMRSHQ